MISVALAANSSASQIDKQRHQFIQAEQAIERGDWDTYKDLSTKLKNFPLYPYLEYQYLLKHLDPEHMGDIQTFLVTYQNTPLANQLRQALINELSAKENWQGVIQNYRHSKNVSNLCHYLYAQHNLGQHKAQQEHVKKLWLTGHSQPNECDPIFKEWLSKGVINDKLIWQRLNLVIKQGNSRLGNYLVEHLSPKYQYLGKSYLQVNQTPMLLASEKNKFINHPNPYQQDIVANGLARLAYKNPTTTLKLWEAYSNTYHFTTAQEALIVEKLARGFAKKKPARLKALLDVMKPNHQNHLALEFLLRYAISTENWSLVVDSIQKLPSPSQTKPVWQYWYARSLEKTSNSKDANRLFREVAKNRNFYGFLAATKLNQPFAIHSTKLTIDKADYDLLNHDPAIARVRELMLLDRNKTSYNEWRFLLNRLDENQKYIAAQVAYDNFWPYLALRTAARAKHQDDLELRFPRMFKTFVRRAKQRHNLKPELLYAMIRQESFFQPDAISHAGARGLMQLMPATAADMAKKINIKRPSNDDLFQPQLNIRLGTEYIKYLLDKFNRNFVLAIAAYNAGPSRVEQWLPDQPQAVDIWVESIPFYETREYVKYVTSYMLIYQHLLGQPSNLQQLCQPVTQTN